MKSYSLLLTLFSLCLMSASHLVTPSSARAQNLRAVDAAESVDEANDEPDDFGYFMSVGFRLKYAFDHAYPLLAGGAGIRYRGLRIGIGFAISSASFDGYRFTRVLPEGTTYKGQSELEVGLVDTTLGLYASYVIDPFASGRVRFEFPIIFGMAGIGTPLMGDDRVTPDGDRVSVWEQDVTDGQDFLTGFGLDVGFVTRFVLSQDVPGLQLGAGIHYSYTTVSPTHVGFDSVHGVSASLALIFEG